MNLPLFGGEKGGQMVTIRVVLDLNGDTIEPKQFLKEFYEYINKGYYIKECEYEHGENEQGKGQAV